MSMLNVLLTAQAPSPKSAALMNIVLLVVMFAVVYFFMIRPQKKKDKELQQMRSKLEIGDEVITTGGIIGRVVSIKDDTVVVETGTDRSKIRFLRNAIQYNT
ncbi:MAG: preprotein translocase subunit YajC, partial [Oscillospiraceae bacterium]